MQLLTDMLCSDFKCGLSGLQEFLNTRKGRYQATLIIAKYKLFGTKPGSPAYEFKGFAAYQKLPCIAENEEMVYSRIPDVLLADTTYPPKIRPLPIFLKYIISFLIK